MRRAIAPPARACSSVRPAVRIDHVIYATRDLDAAAARVQAELGLESLAGGRHEGMGTHNRIVPLGDGYLELLAIAEPTEAASSQLGAAIQAHLAEEGDGLIAWCLEVDSVEAVAERLGTAITPISREGLSARLTGLAEGLRHSWPPFFITRDPGVPDPGAAGDAGGFDWIEVACDAARLADWLDSAELPVRVVDGRPGIRAVGIGDREFRPR